MHKQPAIKRFISLFLLLLFAFSTTPKQWIHDILFHHKDVYTICTDGSTKNHLHKSGFHCELDNIVVLSTFVSDVSYVEPKAPLLHSVYYSKNVSSFSSTPFLFTDLRGPPAIG